MDLNSFSKLKNLCFHEKVTQFGFSRSEDESCIYVKVSGSVVVFQVLYMDDILLIGNDIPTLQIVKDWLGKCFAMKDLGDEAYILGIKIYRVRSKRLIGLSQDTYLDKILKRFKMENSKKGNLHLHHGIKISKDLCSKTDKELDRMSRVSYDSDVGSIMYAMTCTRPDVSFALSMQIDKDDSRSQSGWVFLLNGRVVTWKSSKQDTVSLAVASDGTLYLVNQDRLRTIIVDDLSKIVISSIEPYKEPELVVLETNVSLDQTGQNDQYHHSAQTDGILNDDQHEHSNHNNDEPIIENLPNTEDVHTSKPLSSPDEDASVSNTNPVLTNLSLSISSMASPAP
ncbi:retrotransposon protein, putative, ty1-copia subclass [Tanacetum coccineum]